MLGRREGVARPKAPHWPCCLFSNFILCKLIWCYNTPGTDEDAHGCTSISSLLLPPAPLSGSITLLDSGTPPFARIETLDGSILPTASRVNIERFDLILCLPFSKTTFDKLRTVVASNVFRSSMHIDQLRKDLLHFTGVLATPPTDHEPQHQ